MNHASYTLYYASRKWVGEKLTTVFLALGAELFQSHCDVKILTPYAQSIQHVVNTKKNWHCPATKTVIFGEKNDCMLKVSLSNKKTRRFMKSIGALIGHIFQHLGNDIKWQAWQEII
jgi:hypothetical protein